MVDHQISAGTRRSPAKTPNPAELTKRTHRVRRLFLSVVMVLSIAAAGCTPEELQQNLGTGNFLEQSFEDAFTTGSGLEDAFFRAAAAAEQIAFAIGMRLYSAGP